MRRRLLDAVSLVAAWFKRGRRLRSSNAVVKVNLGSALFVAPGWINVDASVNALLSSAPAFVLRLAHRWTGSNRLFGSEEYCRILRSNKFVHHNFRHGLPFEDDSVDYVYSSHLLEHLYRDDALRLLRDIRRILKPGGWVRICVPDLSHALALFNQGKKEEALEYFFSPDWAGALNRHQYMYDAELLGRALDKSGFVQIARRTYQQGEVPDLKTLDNRPKETLFVEARKGRSEE